MFLANRLRPQQMISMGILLVMMAGMTTGTAHGAGLVSVESVDLSYRAYHTALLQQSGDKVRVIVTLHTPDAEDRNSAQSLNIARAQDRVLDAISEAEFTPTYRYATVAGMAGLTTDAGLAALRAHPDVAAIALDAPIQVAATESALLIRAPQARSAFGVTGQGINVAIIDSGVDLTHPDLAQRIVAQHCFAYGNCPPNNTDVGLSAQDSFGHGTHLAGIIAGQGHIAPPGIAPGAGIVAVRVLDARGAGWNSDVIAAIDWIVANQAALNVRLINLSLGSQSYPGVCDAQDANTQLFAHAVQAARAAGIAVFAASGNRGEANGMMMPACVKDVVAVGSVYDAALGPRAWGICTDNSTAPDQVACFSNSSPALDLLAPGAWIVSTALGGGQKGDAGTSMSTPHAVGVAALLLEADPTLMPATLEAALKNTGVPLTDARSGRVTPRVDAWAAVQSVAPPPTPAPRIISGTITLQARAVHSQTHITLNTAPCAGQEDAPATMPQTLSAQANALGHFSFATDPAVMYRCLSARAPGYLESQAIVGAPESFSFSLLAGDVNADNHIDLFDLVYVAAHLNGNTAAADLNADGQVNIFDLTLMAANYDQQGPIVYGK